MQGLLDRIAEEKRLARMRGIDRPVEDVVDEVVSNLRGKPVVKKEIVELLKKKERLLAELREVNEKLEEAARL